MRWTTHAIAVTLGLFVLAANTEPAAAQQRDNGGKGGQGRRATHEEHDRVTNAAFSATVDEQGNAVVTAKVDDFILEKAVASTGDTTIRLMRGKDIVSIAMNHGGYAVARGRKTARFDPQSGKQEDMDAIRAVLLGSPAVRKPREIRAGSLKTVEIWSNPGLLLLALVLLAAEWALRRRAGHG